MSDKLDTLDNVPPFISRTNINLDIAYTQGTTFYLPVKSIRLVWVGPVQVFMQCTRAKDDWTRSEELNFSGSFTFDETNFPKGVVAIRLRSSAPLVTQGLLISTHESQ